MKITRYKLLNRLIDCNLVTGKIDGNFLLLRDSLLIGVSFCVKSFIYF